MSPPGRHPTGTPVNIPHRRASVIRPPLVPARPHWVAQAAGGEGFWAEAPIDALRRHAADISLSLRCISQNDLVIAPLRAETHSLRAFWASRDSRAHPRCLLHGFPAPKHGFGPACAMFGAAALSCAAFGSLPCFGPNIKTSLEPPSVKQVSR